MSLTLQEEAYLKKQYSLKVARDNYNAKVLEKQSAIKQAKLDYDNIVSDVNSQYDTDIQSLQDALNSLEK